jgi:cation diffusion facilitator CzcD-associated flavoprotein CzcO
VRETTAAVIGAGISGLAAAIKLKESGCKVTVYETSPSVGGTWFDNDYPGAEVDTPSVLYSLSFSRRPWSRTHGRRAELLEYLQSVAMEYGLTRDLRLGTSVTSIEWLEADQAWSVELDDGTQQTHDVVVSAIGFLNQPKTPDWPGLESFAGPVFHAARWDREVSTDGRRVAVVGSGSTAAQLVPALAKTPAEVVMFQREPGWILPKGVRDHSDRERWARTWPRRSCATASSCSARSFSTTLGSSAAVGPRTKPPRAPREGSSRKCSASAPTWSRR